MSVGRFKIRQTGTPVTGGSVTFDADVNDKNLKLLLHGNGTHGSTNFVDDSYAAQTLTTLVGSPIISTAQSKFGGSSLYFDGSSAITVTTGGSDFNLSSADFTIEAWIYPTSLPAAQTIISKDQYGATFDWCIIIVNNNQLLFATQNTYTLFYANTSLSTNTWYHVAFVHKGNTNTFYVNGIALGSSNFSVTNNVSQVTVGCASYNNPSAFFNGYLDDVRVTKGAARYTGNFTPPTSALPSYVSLESSYPSPKVGDSVVSYDKIYLCTATGPTSWMTGSIL